MPLPQLVNELDECGIDYFHVDCKDNLNVFDDIEAIRKISKTPIDLHIISSEPHKFYSPIKELGVEWVTFQHEDLGMDLDFPHEIDCKLGVAITSNTPVSTYESYHEQSDFILFMTTTPGESGGSFNKGTFHRIREFQKNYPGKRVHVDGGVNAEVSFILRNMGVDASVSGSYLVNAGSIGAALVNLKTLDTASPYTVSDFMMTREELPILLENDLTLKHALESIEKYRLGFCLITDNNGQLKGLISNADVRRGLIRNIDQLNNIRPENLINNNPITIRGDQDVSELLRLVKAQKFPILYLPVVDQQQKLIGAITFNNLIKGEL